jgi:hypothetical protein
MKYRNSPNSGRTGELWRSKERLQQRHEANNCVIHVTKLSYYTQVVSTGRDNNADNEFRRGNVIRIYSILKNCAAQTENGTAGMERK